MGIFSELLVNRDEQYMFGTPKLNCSFAGIGSESNRWGFGGKRGDPLPKETSSAPRATPANKAANVMKAAGPGVNKAASRHRQASSATSSHQHHGAAVHGGGIYSTAARAHPTPTNER